MQSLRLSGHSVNLILIADEKLQSDFPVVRRFPVRLEVLCAASDYFNCILRRDIEQFSEKRVPEKFISDVSAEILEIILDFIYTGLADITMHVVSDVYTTADFFTLPELVNVCQRFLSENCIDNELGIIPGEVHCKISDLIEHFNDQFLEALLEKFRKQSTFLFKEVWIRRGSVEFIKHIKEHGFYINGHLIGGRPLLELSKQVRPNWLL